MTSEFGDWTGDDPVGDDADTADLGGPVDGSGDPAVEGFGAADPVEGFGAADPPVDDDLSGDDTTGGGYGGGDAVPALGYGDDLSGADPAEPVDAGFGAEPAAEQGFGAADPPPGVDPDAATRIRASPAVAGVGRAVGDGRRRIRCRRRVRRHPAPPPPRAAGHGPPLGRCRGSPDARPADPPHRPSAHPVLSASADRRSTPGVPPCAPWYRPP